MAHVLPSEWHFSTAVQGFDSPQGGVSHLQRGGNDLRRNIAEALAHHYRGPHTRQSAGGRGQVRDKHGFRHVRSHPEADGNGSSYSHHPSGGAGDLFEFGLLHHWGLAVGFVDRDMVVTAQSRVRTFSLSLEALVELSKGSEATRLAWQAVIISALAREAERGYKGKAKLQRLTADQLSSWRDPAFAKLAEEELPRGYVPGSGRCLTNPLGNVLKLMVKTLSPPFPFSKPHVGLRHSAINTRQDPRTLLETGAFLRAAVAAEQSGRV